MIVSVIFVVVFEKASLNLIYTVFSQSHVDSVYGKLDTHDTRFSGSISGQLDTCTYHTHTSVGHVIFNVTHVWFVYVAFELIVNNHHSGGVASYKYVHVLLIHVFHAISNILNLIVKSDW